MRVEKHLPLGIGPHDTPASGTPNGVERSFILQNAVTLGAGSLGEHLTRAIWDDWEGFQARVTRYQAQVTGSEASEWVRPLAAAAAGLDYLLEVCNVPPLHRPAGLTTWAHGVLCTSRADNDVAENAFEELRALVLNAAADPYKSHVRTARGERVAYKGGEEYLVLQNSEAVKRVLEPYGKLQGLGAQWVRRGWITPDSDGGKSTARRFIDGTRQRVLVVPRKTMEDGPA